MLLDCFNVRRRVFLFALSILFFHAFPAFATQEKNHFSAERPVPCNLCLIPNTEEIPGNRASEIRRKIEEAKKLLAESELQYRFTKTKKGNLILSKRPIAFAAWSEKTQDWHIVHLEIPFPMKPLLYGEKMTGFRVMTNGYQAEHVRGTGAVFLMFTIWRGEERLRVFGRKFPTFDATLMTKKRHKAMVEESEETLYLPYTDDVYDPTLVRDGKRFLREKADRALETLEARKVPSLSFPGRTVGDVFPPEVLMILPVIEQIDIDHFRNNHQHAMESVLIQYGLWKEEAFANSTSNKKALGAFQFTNRKGNGTYALVRRLYPKAHIDPVFERGARNFENSAIAAACLLDYELSHGYFADLRMVFSDHPHVLSIFPIAAYNGGPGKARRLYDMVQSAGIKLLDLHFADSQSAVANDDCPCMWKKDGDTIIPVPIEYKHRKRERRAIQENTGYVEKYFWIIHYFLGESIAYTPRLPSGCFPLMLIKDQFHCRN